ncbi:MAG: EAL domain-containing protein [Pseudohongiellaceae bacterium]
MEREAIYRILLTSGNDPVAEQLLNLLRRAGLTVQGRDITAGETLTDTLASEPWHLILAFSDTREPAVDSILAHLRETRLDIPCIVIDNARDPIGAACLARGAADVFALDELQQDSGHQRFVHRVQSELQQINERRERRRLAIALQEIEQHYHRLLDNTTDPVAWLGDGLYQYCNPAWLDFLGHAEADELLHTPLLDQVADSDVDPTRQCLRKTMEPQGTESVANRCALKIQHHDGSMIPVELDCTVISHRGERILQIHLQPATGTTGHRNTMDDLAGRDLVTGLPARKRMLDAVTRQVSRAVYQGQTAMLVVLELENFEAVQSVMGRADSNLMLGDFTGELRRLAPSDAHCGRISDSGFAILLPDADGPEPFLEQVPALNRLLQNLLPERLQCHLSAGMAVISGESADAETLLVRAQHNRVLRANRRTELGTEARQHRQLAQVRKALDSDDLSLVYQPVVSLREDGLERYEVRVRLRDGEQLIHPADFLETVTQHGMGTVLDRHVIARALELLTSGDNKNLRLILNVTLNSISDGTLLGWLADALRTRHLPARLLILQVSEIDALSAPDDVAAFCERLHELDVGVSICHFGGAMDPFQHLNLLSPAYAKLDRSLLSAIDRDAEQHDRLQQLIKGLHARGILVIAPMVEHMELLPLLWQAKVNFVQGNVLREPGPSLDFGFVQDQEITLQSPSGRSA